MDNDSDEYEECNYDYDYEYDYDYDNEEFLLNIETMFNNALISKNIKYILKNYFQYILKHITIKKKKQYLNYLMKNSIVYLYYLMLSIIL